MSTFVITDYADKPDIPLTSSVSCNIIQITNVAQSKEKTLEEWKYYHNPNTAPFERMEHVSRPVIYGIDLEETEQVAKVSSAKATYKLLLRDQNNNYFYALEMEEIPFLHPREKSTNSPLPIPLGGRVMLQKGTIVHYGMVLLRKHQCNYLGVDMNSDLAKQLNDGAVKKYIDVMEQQLRASARPGGTM
ncbi:CIC11C00000002082 [Sungouiella intermedia]|uniref:CIC11C00000002082 n=1 Tax=Sungouiella intermedia TaxID=45354 RepID=A0A1L0BZH3_9ASCO|nr:CIC11C00000002082 [[Candida] intermedia]